MHVDALPNTRRRQLLHVGAASALAVGGARAAVPMESKIEVRDALGRRVTLPRAAERIVTIFSSNTELVSSLGLVDRIIGVEDYTRFPPEIALVPKVGGRLGFSVDKVVAARPDLVIVTPARQAAHQLVDPMERLGIPIVVLLSRSLAEVIGNLRLVGQLAGVDARAQQLEQTLRTRLATVDAFAALGPQPTVLMITGRLGNGMVLVARPNTYTGEAMLRVGGRPALPQLGTLAQVSPEAILAADPDVLLFAGSQTALDDLIAQPGWREMRAVRTQSAISVSRSEFLIPGPRTFDGIETLSQWMRQRQLALPDARCARQPRELRA